MNSLHYNVSLNSILRQMTGAALIFACSLHVSAAPYRPTAETVVLLLTPHEQQLSHDHKALRGTHITQAEIALPLAQRYLALGRTQNDERYIGYALATLQHWQDATQAPVEVLLTLADIAQHQHRFNDALKLLDRALVKNVNHARAHLMRASIALAQGKPQQARTDCQHLFALRELFSAAVCNAQVMGLNGKLNTAYTLLTTLLPRTPLDTADMAVREQYSWAYGIAADMAARAGNLSLAQQHLHSAITLSPTQLPLRLQLSDVLLKVGDATQAIAILNVAPATEPVLLRRALAAQQLPDRSNQKLALEQWQQATEQNKTLGIRLHLRELARGQLELLHDAPLATQTALENWQVQREPEDARLLQQAATASHNLAAAQMVQQWQQALQLEDVELAP